MMEVSRRQKGAEGGREGGRVFSFGVFSTHGASSRRSPGVG